MDIGIKNKCGWQWMELEVFEGGTLMNCDIDSVEEALNLVEKMESIVQDLKTFIENKKQTTNA